MVGILRGCERVCSWPVRPPSAEVRAVCMHAGSGGVCGCWERGVAWVLSGGPLTARATSMIEPKRTHQLYCPLHRLWAHLSLVVIVFLSYGL